MIGFIIGFGIGAFLGIVNALLLIRYANKKLARLVNERVDLLQGHLEAHELTLTAIDEGLSLAEIRDATVAAIERIEKAIAYKHERAKNLAQEDVMRDLGRED